MAAAMARGAPRRARRRAHRKRRRGPARGINERVDAGQARAVRRRDLAADRPSGPRPDEGLSRARRRSLPRPVEEARPAGKPERGAAAQRRSRRDSPPAQARHGQKAAAAIVSSTCHFTGSDARVWSRPGRRRFGIGEMYDPCGTDGAGARRDTAGARRDSGEHGKRAIRSGATRVNTIMTCGNCHSPKGPPDVVAGKDFSGGLSWDEPPFKVTATNITQDKETGIGTWSDADIKKLLRTDMRPNGLPIA